MFAYSYVRFSTPDQLKGDSLRRQTEKSDQYIAEKGLVLDTSLKMQDLGISAYDQSNVTKGALGGFLQAIDRGLVKPGSVLIVESLDRLSRAEPMTALELFLGIIRKGITIVTLSDRQEYSKETIGNNSFLLFGSIMVMIRAHEESSIKSQRIRSAWSSKKKALAESGKLLTKKTPLWLEVVDGKLKLIPERAKVVKQVYEMARSGNGGGIIVKVLNEEVEPWNKAGFWQTSYVQKMLTNPAVYGAIEIDGEIIENYYPPILSKEEWMFIAASRQKRKTTERAGSRKGQGVSNLFSGLLKCGYCGARIQMSGYVETRFGAHKRRKYLICHGARTAATNCKCIQWDYNEFESSFLLRATALDLSVVLGDRSEDTVKSLEESAASVLLRIDELSKKIENLYVAIEEAPSAGLATRVKKLEDEREVLLSNFKEAEKHIVVERMSQSIGEDRIKTLLRLFREQKIKTDDEKRILRESLSEHIRSIVDKIEMFPGGPTCSKDGREERYFNVFFRSGKVVEMV